MVRLWVDDERPMPPGYDYQTASVEEAIRLISRGEVTRISLDHDLGDKAGGTGYDIAKFIEEHADVYNVPIEWSIHSQNPVGRKNMEIALKNADKIWQENRPNCMNCDIPLVADGRNWYCIGCGEEF